MHNREGGRARATARGGERWRRRQGHLARFVGSVGLVVVVGGCSPWVGLPSVWGCGTRIVVDAPRSQAVIDAGEVGNWTGCWPGDGCTVHLAAHRSTHGSTFAAVPRLQTGDVVELGYAGTVYRYRVDSLQVVRRSTPVSELIVGDLVVQTSHPDSRLAYLVYATLISPAA